MLLVLCVNLSHTKTIENINVWKRTEAWTEAGAMKKESSRAGAGAMLMKRRARLSARMAKIPTRGYPEDEAALLSIQFCISDDINTVRCPVFSHSILTSKRHYIS